MPAIHEDNQLNASRSAEIDERIEGCARRPARVQHIVYEENLAFIDGERNFGATHERLRSDRVPHQIVAIERDVEGTGRNVGSGNLPQAACEPPSQMISARTHPDQGQIVNTSIALQDFVCDSGEGAADPVRIHNDGVTFHESSSRSLRAAVKESLEYTSKGKGSGLTFTEAAVYDARTNRCSAYVRATASRR